MVPNYSFDWQLPYYLAPDEVRLPAKTTLECVAHFDNSTFNPYNADPSATVRDGQSDQEMMYGIVFYTVDDERLDLEVDRKSGHAR